MITVFDIMSVVFTLAFMLAIGGSISESYGIGWGIAAAVVVAVIGIRLWKLRMKLMVNKARKQLAELTVDDLRQHLYSRPFSCPNGWTPNFLLMELKARGEDITEHIDLILNMMEDESSFLRAMRRGALYSAYPFLAYKIKGYRPEKPIEQCREKVTELRKIWQIAKNEGHEEKEERKS
ncbi:MAG: hypothetical protein KAS96_03585 [Planctomycetes bacterium]|nr:hypothetical protein [Planctomycetota bacterium]